VDTSALMSKDILYKWLLTTVVTQSVCYILYATTLTSHRKNLRPNWLVFIQISVILCVSIINVSYLYADYQNNSNTIVKYILLGEIAFIVGLYLTLSTTILARFRTLQYSKKTRLSHRINRVALVAQLLVVFIVLFGIGVISLKFVGYVICAVCVLFLAYMLYMPRDHFGAKFELAVSLLGLALFGFYLIETSFSKSMIVVWTFVVDGLFLLSVVGVKVWEFSFRFKFSYKSNMRTSSLKKAIDYPTASVAIADFLIAQNTDNYFGFLLLKDIRTFKRLVLESYLQNDVDKKMRIVPEAQRIFNVFLGDKNSPMYICRSQNIGQPVVRLIKDRLDRIVSSEAEVSGASRDTLEVRILFEYAEEIIMLNVLEALKFFPFDERLLSKSSSKRLK